MRELVGVPEGCSQFWSKRRDRIDVRRAALAVQFQAEHGRPPTPVEALKLAQQATLETRDAKHEARSEASSGPPGAPKPPRVLGSTGESTASSTPRWPPAGQAAPRTDARPSW